MNRLFTLLAPLAFLTAAQASTIALPTASYQLGDGSVRPLPLVTRASNSIPGATDFSAQLTIDGDMFDVSGTAKPDPFISFTVNVVDFGEASYFQFGFFSPLSGGPYGKAITELNGTVDEIRTTNGVTGLTFDAGVGADFQSVSFDPDLRITGSPCTVGGCGPFGPVEKFGNFNGGAMRVVLGFTGPGGGNKASFTGKLTILPVDESVPEPAAISMTALGVASLIWLRKRSVR